MKRVAIIRCLRSNDVCTGFACMQAFQHKTGKFAEYGDEEIELMAYATCNGCGNVQLGEDGLRSKIDFLKKLRLDAVHIGICTKHKDSEGKRTILCPTIEKITQELSWSGVKIVDGTHD